MHRHRILAQFSLILSLLNLVLAAPIAVQNRHGTPRDGIVVTEGVAAMLKKQHGLEASSDRSTFPRSPPDEIAATQHSSLFDESTSSGFPSPPPRVSAVDSESWDSDHSSFVPPHPNQNPSAPIPLATLLRTPSLHGSASTHSSISGPGSSAIQLPEEPQGLQAEKPPSPPPPVGPASLASHGQSNSWSSEIPHISIPDWLRTFELVPGRVTTQLRTGSDQATTEAHDPPPDQSTPEELTPSHHLTSGGPPPSHSSPPIDSPPDNANFFDKDAIRFGIPAAVFTVGVVLTAGIVGLELKDHNQPDS